MRSKIVEEILGNAPEGLSEKVFEDAANKICKHILKEFKDNNEAMDAEVTKQTVYYSEADVLTLMNRVAKQFTH